MLDKSPCGDKPVSFDIVKEWARKTFGREVEDVPFGCGWQSVARVLKPEGTKRSTRDGDDASEEQLRLDVVEYYRALSPHDVKQILAEKLEDPMSFFNIVKYESVDTAFDHWSWYLFCLTFCTAEVTDHLTKTEFVVRMPLDKVDLRVIAHVFDVQIVVSSLFEETWRFQVQPAASTSTRCLHLVLWRGSGDAPACTWAPLRGSLPQEAELVGAVAELWNFSGQLEILNRQKAVIVDYDNEEKCYIAFADQLRFHLHRSQIKRVVLYNEITKDSDANRSWSRPWSKRAELAPPVAGIPDGSVEFQILLNLVRKEASTRLQKVLNQESGRESAGSSTAVAAGSSTVYAAPGAAYPSTPAKAAAAPQSQIQPQTRQQAHMDQWHWQQPQQSQQSQQPQQRVVQQIPARIPQSHSASGRRTLPVENAFDLAERGENVLVVSIASSSEANHLAFEASEQIRILKRHRTRTDLALGTRSLDAAIKKEWFCVDKIEAWEVIQDFAPAEDWSSPEAYLTVRVGQLLVILQQLSEHEGWEDYAQAERYPHGTSREQAKGVVDLKCLRKVVVLAA